MKARHPDIPWRKMSGSGNIYRHDYEDVAHRLVWGTVHESLRRCGLLPKPSLQPTSDRQCDPEWANHTPTHDRHSSRSNW